MKCDSKIEASARGGHSVSCRGTVWNKGQTKDTSETLRRMGVRQRGVKRPETAKRVREKFQDSAFRAKHSAAVSRAQTIRFQDPTQREASRARALRLIEVGRIVPFGGRNHGNGQVPTDAEIEMERRLGAYGFVANFVVATKIQRGLGFPTHYKIDLANPATLIAIEIDGSSHSRARRETDARKTSFLELKKWQVFRFRVPFDYDVGARCCIEASKSRAASTT